MRYIKPPAVDNLVGYLRSLGLSIDFDISVEPKGDRWVVILDGKFISSKYNVPNYHPHIRRVSASLNGRGLPRVEIETVFRLNGEYSPY